MVLVLGTGAREHAIVRSLAADPTVTTVVAAPGNPGMASAARCVPVDLTDNSAVVALADSLDADLVVVGPEAPLVAGVSDALWSAGVPCFGPSAAAARLEGSKAFAKEVMAAAGVPTARARVATTVQEAEDALDAMGAPHVVKDDGLAAGKGVVVTDDRDEALAHATACLSRPGGRIVIEEYLDGPEVSVFCITDGTRVLPMAPSQDFKRVGDGDAGPNTGGMGAYCPLEWLPDGFADEVVARVAQPTIDEMRHRGTPFVGVLYVGLAVTSRGMRVVEFNARFGDPDSQVCLARLTTPLGHLLYAAATGQLDDVPYLTWSSDHAVSVVVASEGYPEAPVTGEPILGIEAAESMAAESMAAESRAAVTVLHAGTRRDAEDRLVSAGGRVLNVIATGPGLGAARRSAYAAVDKISLRGSHHRTDIADPDRLPTRS